MKTIIYTSFPCFLKFEGKEETLSQNENLTIEEEIKNIQVYPTQKGRISFEIDCDIKESTFYRIIEKNGKRLIFLIDGLYAENAEIAEFDYSGTKSKLEVYPQKVIFSNKINKKIIHLNQNYRSFKYGNIKFIDYCLLQNHNGESSLVAYNAKKNTAKIFKAEEITLDNNEFTLKNSVFGYASITQHLYVDDEGLKIKKKDFVQASSHIAPEETLAYQFLNSYKYGDYKQCLSMLAPELNDRLDAEGLKAYFGNISYFYMISPTTAYAISNDKNILFEFAFKEEKICEISSE